MQKRGRNKKSLGENSMKMVANIIKLSSFSIAKISLGATGPSPTKNLAPFKGSVKVANDPPLPQIPGSQRLQDPWGGSRTMSYLIEAAGGTGSSYVIREEKSVDGKASDYIRKVHEKNRYESNETSTLSAHIMPPPPGAVM